MQTTNGRTNDRMMTEPANTISSTKGSGELIIIIIIILSVCSINGNIQRNLANEQGSLGPNVKEHVYHVENASISSLSFL